MCCSASFVTVSIKWLSGCKKRSTFSKRICWTLDPYRSDEKIGAVEDLIITPDKAVSYAIVGTGGFLGIDRHDVAIPVGQLQLEGDKLMLAGATKEGLKALPKFEYAK